MLALSMCTILALTGCGQDDTAQTGTEPPSDAVHTEAETETEKTDKDAPSLEDVAVMPDETNAGRAQMEIDEETRKELRSTIWIHRWQRERAPRKDARLICRKGLRSRKKFRVCM